MAKRINFSDIKRADYAPTNAKVNNVGLLPKTDYNYNAFAGNTNAQVKAMENIGLERNGNYASGFGKQTPSSWNGNTDHFNSALNDFNQNHVSIGGGGGGIGNIGGFTPSPAYKDAMAYTQSLLDKINSGRTSYSDKVDEMMNKIANRDKFSYDFNTDPLFQNMLGSAMAAGQTAMQDTMGQASSLTGGYGSSYAQSVGNQAYNNYVKDAYAQLPDYYNLALNAYNMEGQDLYNQLGMYRDADNTEFGRLTTAYGANLDKANTIYNQEYQNFWDTADYNQEAAKFNAQQSLNNAKFKYQQYKDALDRQDAIAASSQNGGYSSASIGSTISSSQLKDLKTELKAMAEKYGPNSSKLDEYILKNANAYNLGEGDISDLYSYISANAPSTKLTLASKNGNYVYQDQWGKPYQGADRQLIKIKTATNEDNNEYQDNYGNIYTQSQIKSIYGKDWKKYVK